MTPSTVLLPPHPRRANQALRSPRYASFDERSNQFGTLVAERFGRLGMSGYYVVGAGSTGQARCRRGGRWSDAHEIYSIRSSCCLGDHAGFNAEEVPALHARPKG